MRTLGLLLLIVAAVLSGFSTDSKRTDNGVVIPMKFTGTIITNPSAGYTVCTPTGYPYPTIAHSRFGTLEGHQTYGGKLQTSLSTWEIHSCNTDFTTGMNYSQITGMNTLANGDTYFYNCLMTVDLNTMEVTLNITVDGGTGIYDSVTGQAVLKGIHDPAGIPVSGEGYLVLPRGK